MPGKFFAGPIGPVEIVAIMGAMAFAIFIALGIAARRQAGPTVIDLGQPTLGRFWQWGLFAAFLASAVISPLIVAREDMAIYLVTNVPPVALFLIAIVAAFLFGVRPGRRELAERGLLQGGWRLALWEDLDEWRWQTGAAPKLELRFHHRRTAFSVDPAQLPDVDQFLRGVAPGRTQA